MTTQKTPANNPEQDDFPELENSIPIEDAVAILLDPFIPALNEKEAEKVYSTNEIIAALEAHYGVPQGDTSFVTADAGLRVVKRMQELGFHFINTGDLQLQWLLKLK